MSETKIIKAKKVSNFTEVQVRIGNTQLNFKAALTIPFKDLPAYIDKIRKEGDWKKFSHLPLVSFVDRDDLEEVVFNTAEDLPSGPCDLVTERGELIARLI